MRTGVIEVTSASDEIKGVATFCGSAMSGVVEGADGVELCEVTEDWL